MKNPYCEIKNEIQDWLQSRGYSVNYIYGVRGIYIRVGNKLSSVDLNQFNEDFCCDLTLKEVDFNEFGEKSQFEYHCFHSRLDDFEMQVRQWLNYHGFPFNYIRCSDDIFITCFDELSDNQIRDFENEFEVKCRKYTISCGVQSFEYIFL